MSRVYSQIAVPLLSALKLIPPGSIGLLVLCSAIGIGLLVFVRSTRRVMRIALLLLYFVYFVLAIPRVANGLAASLPATRAGGVTTPMAFEAIIVLDGDNRRGRVRAALQLEEGSSPPPVIVMADAGDPWVVDNLASGGVSRTQITSEAGADTTRGQVELARRMIASHSWGHVALVASRLQSPRLSGLTREWRPLPVIVAAPVDDEPPHDGLWAFVPSYLALRVSRDALYEHAALSYYRWRGWI